MIESLSKKKIWQNRRDHPWHLDPTQWTGSAPKAVWSFGMDASQEPLEAFVKSQDLGSTLVHSLPQKGRDIELLLFFTVDQLNDVIQVDSLLLLVVLFFSLPGWGVQVVYDRS